MTNDHTDLQKKHFDAIAKTYVSGRSGKNHLSYKSTLWFFFLSKVKTFLPKRPDLIGLEAMCGNAEVSERVGAFFPQIKMDAFDLSEEMIALSNRLKNRNITIFQKDILKFNEREKYDLIIVIGGLHHIPHDIEIGLRNVFDALKPGGIFINFEPTHNNFLWRIVREKIYKKNKIFEETSEKGFILNEYNKNLLESHFQIVYQFYPGLLGYILYYNPDAFPFLDIGPTWLARLLGNLDVFLGKTVIGKKFSFATFTIADKKSGS